MANHYEALFVPRRITTPPARGPFVACGHRETEPDRYRECRRHAGHTDPHDYGLWEYPQPPKECA